MHKRGELVAAIYAEVHRIFGPKGPSGDAVTYHWLARHYGVTEEEDNQWLDISLFEAGNLDDDDWDEEERAQRMAILNDEAAVCAFLTELLGRYQQGKALFRRDPLVKMMRKRGLELHIFLDNFTEHDAHGFQARYRAEIHQQGKSIATIVADDPTSHEETVAKAYAELERLAAEAAP